MGFSKKKGFFFKIAKGGKFAAENLLNGMTSQNIFSRPVMRFFLAKNQRNQNVGKIGEYDEKEIFREKKPRSSALKSFFIKMGRRKICR